jgi:hypothetical protein
MELFGLLGIWILFFGLETTAEFGFEGLKFVSFIGDYNDDAGDQEKDNQYANN